MGAGDWVSGGLRRAVSGVRSAMPGQGEPEPAEEPGTVLVNDADPAEHPAPPTKKAPTKKAPTTKAPTTKVAKRNPVEAAPAKDPVSTAPVTKAATTAPAAKPLKKGAPAKSTEASTAPAMKRAATKAPVPASSISEGSPAPEPAPGQVPTWTATELDGFRAALETDILRLREELNMGAADMADLLADSGDGAGDDQADAGSKTLEREQEMSVNANARGLLEQSTHALRRLEAGRYGLCESCGSLIPAARLRAFPRATLCIACKQAEERR